MAQHKINGPQINRRRFVAGAMSLPIAASALGQASGVLAPPIAASVKPIQLATAFYANMMQRWTWYFDLERGSDGTFTLVSQQVHEFPDDEPWEIEPRRGLRSGRDVYQALDAEISLVDEGMSEEVVANAEKALAVIDPKLAEEFRREAEEWELEDCGDW